MATSPNLLRALQAYLRRRYINDLPGLKLEADRVFLLATEVVTITSHSFVDGSASGEITCPRVDYLLALEGLIAEFEPAAASGGYPGGHVVDFSRRLVET